MTIEEQARSRGLAWYPADSPQAQAEAVATHVAALLKKAIEQRGHASLALSGGRGPELFLRRLEQIQLDWEKVTITQVDERWVPPEHEQSNAGLIQRCMPQLLQRATWLPLYQGRSLEADAQHCHTMLKTLMPVDVVVLGMGPDGHTASLFPHMPKLPDYLSEQTPALCIAVPETAERLARLSMTAAVINQARSKILALSGEDKLQQLATALETSDPLARPIAAFLTPSMDIFYSP
ncbi:6-phosphogluconolactonase [Halopseudomonas litoralis]|uniref:6-phosphogluconolactonase n=1 Tax=Halopseudomonas litoralis TaxID=797277 RepID=A0A1H1N8Y4_9GAMM|nr:6-phosphogluconolactonase [Halopseudomonas litoralis]SDR95462.1 6-phosphogluconolactonase [Halopseudomonas litoralis]